MNTSTSAVSGAGSLAVDLFPAAIPVHVPNGELLDELLQLSAARHHHICPRQVLGVRIGLYGLRLLGFTPDDERFRYRNSGKRLLTIAEMDGCGADGIAAATDCRVGTRTLRIEDYGKMAAAFIDARSGAAVRVAPSAAARELAQICMPHARSRWHAYLDAYKILPDEQLLTFRPVRLRRPVREIVSRAGVRVNCDSCGEEIMNGREVPVDGRIHCLHCAGHGRYYDE